MGGWNALWAEEEAAERVTGVAGVVAEDFFKGDAAAASSCFFFSRVMPRLPRPVVHTQKALTQNTNRKGSYTKHEHKGSYSKH